MSIIYTILHNIIMLLIVVVVIQSILTFFMNPDHPVRRTLDSIINPFLNPIRSRMPQTGNLDFSPLVLIIVLYILDWLLGIVFFRLI